MRDQIKTLVSWAAAGTWWLADRLWGDHLFEAVIKPMIPEAIIPAEAALDLAITFGPPILLIGLGVYFMMRRTEDAAVADNEDKPSRPRWTGISLSHGKNLTVHKVKAAGFDTSFKIRDVENATLTDNVAEGHGDSIGYDIQNAPRANLSRSVSRNNRVGYRVRDSEDTNLSDTRAEGAEPSQSGRKLYTVRLPPGMKSPGDE